MEEFKSNGNNVTADLNTEAKQTSKDDEFKYKLIFWQHGKTLIYTPCSLYSQILLVQYFYISIFILFNLKLEM